MRASLLRPPTFALMAGLALLSLGVITGGALTTFQDSIYAVARREIIRRPEVHRFSGAEVIDQARITEVADQANTALRLLHSHALGVGTLVLISSVLIANLPLVFRTQTILCALVSVGALYPLGWLLLAALIPYLGVDALRPSVDMLIFIPFGTAIILGIVLAFVLSAAALVRRFIDGPI
jgi:hypothetical protein